MTPRPDPRSRTPVSRGTGGQRRRSRPAWGRARPPDRAVDAAQVIQHHARGAERNMRTRAAAASVGRLRSLAPAGRVRPAAPAPAAAAAAGPVNHPTVPCRPDAGRPAGRSPPGWVDGAATAAAARSAELMAGSAGFPAVAHRPAGTARRAVVRQHRDRRADRATAPNRADAPARAGTGGPAVTRGHARAAPRACRSASSAAARAAPPGGRSVCSAAGRAVTARNGAAQDTAAAPDRADRVLGRADDGAEQHHATAEPHGVAAPDIGQAIRDGRGGGPVPRHDRAPRDGPAVRPGARCARAAIRCTEAAPRHCRVPGARRRRIRCSCRNGRPDPWPAHGRAHRREPAATLAGPGSTAAPGR